MRYVVLILGSYLLGSIPFGLIIAKSHGKDLRTIGSGNIGATNLARALGKRWGYLCFLLDMLKGFIPMFVAGSLLSSQPGMAELFLRLATGFAAIIGHIFPIYLKFKGGKGVATSFGFSLGLWPYYTICAFVTIIIWIPLVLIWRYISLASMIASLFFPGTLIVLIAVKQNWDFVSLWPLVITAAAIPVMVITRHKTNIKRIIAGTESKITKN